jgi:serine/threonine-protein kinase
VVRAARIERTCPRCQRTFDSDAVFCPADGAALESPGDTPPDTDRYIGTVIHGDIEIKSVAGAGAMGRVYRAYQRGIERDVAVKILHRELSGNVPLVQRFHREAKIASRLQHPHVVDVYLAGQLPDGALYIVMEYLDGLSLAAATTAAAGMMNLERALPIALQICDAVGEGHARGIVHRDLKPENVMLVHRADTRDWVKVLDFGIAKVSLGEQSMETAAGLIFGTARYISPEGAQGATVGPPGDVYSIAVILYQLFSGRTPFEADQPVGLLIKHIHDEPPLLTSWPAAAGVPASIARVIMDNLAKDPAQRAPSARALGNAIAAAAREAKVSFSDVGVVARMSALDLVRSRREVALEPTLDDASAQPPPGKPSHSLRTPTPAPKISAIGLRRPQADVDVPPPRPDATGRDHADARDAGLAAAKRSTTFVIILAFMLGVAVTALVMQYVLQRPDEERRLHLQRAHRALVSGHYIEPPGECVRDLVIAGLKRWPDDPELANVQTEAAHEIVTRAMAARSGGDVAGAHDLAKTAHDLDPADATARLLLAQYDDELVASDSDGGTLGGVRVTLDLPIGKTRLGSSVDLDARITMGASPHSVTWAQFVVVGPGSSERVRIPVAGSGPYHATFTPPREGGYEMQFEANVAGATVRAERNLTVTR